MNKDDAILEFVSFLGGCYTAFRKAHIIAEKVESFSHVVTSAIPAQTAQSDFSDEGGTISIALNADLKKPLDADKQALGMEMTLRRQGGVWIAEYEVGWSGRNIGWDPFESKEDRANSLIDIVERSHDFIMWMRDLFVKEINNIEENANKNW